MTDRPLRIAFLLPTFPELTNVFILNQVTGLLDRGHEVDLYALGSKSFKGAHPDVARYDLRSRMRHIPIPRTVPRRYLDAGSRLFARGSWHPALLDAFDLRRHGRDAANLSRLYTTLSFLDSGPYDVVHAQFGQLGQVAQRLVACGAVRARVVTSFRGSDATRRLTADPTRYRELFRSGDLFLPVSDNIRDRLVAAGAPPDRVQVLRSGISLERFAFEPRTPPTGAATLLFVGRLTEKKGVAYLIDALGHLRSSDRRVELVIVGDGQLMPSLRRRAEERGLEESVRFLGAQGHDEVVAAMRRVHVLVAPSVTAADGDQEGIPNVLKEAMASGLPVVATAHGGIPELVEDGVDGLLVPERDATTLATRIAKLLDQPERWSEITRAAREKIERSYDREKLNDRLVELYRDVVDERGAEPVRALTRAPSA